MPPQNRERAFIDAAKSEAMNRTARRSSAEFAGHMAVSQLRGDIEMSVPSVRSRMWVEAAAGFMQFSLFGLALGWLDRRPVATS